METSGMRFTLSGRRGNRQDTEGAREDAENGGDILNCGWGKSRDRMEQNGTNKKTRILTGFCSTQIVAGLAFRTGILSLDLRNRECFTHGWVGICLVLARGRAFGGRL